LSVLLDAQRRLNESSDIIGIMGRCIRSDLLDSQFEMSCCGLEGYGSDCVEFQPQPTDLCPIDNTSLPPASFRPVGEYFANPACNNSTSRTEQLEDSRFNCSVLQEICTAVPCSGVDSDLLRSLSIEADCQVEVYIIRCCLLVLLALYHAIMVNLFSTLALSSIKHLRWRSLQPDGIKFRTQMTPDGVLVKGASRDERAERVAVAMRRFELTGWVQLALAVAIFIFWFISFFVLRRLLQDWNNA